MPTKPCDLPCPKCGTSDIYRTFHSKGTIIEPSSYGRERERASSEFVSRKNTYSHLVLKDCLTNVCRCCGYLWDVGPLQPKTPKAKKAKA
jgi:hypothetical protein